MSIKSTIRAIFTLGKGVTKGLDESRDGENPIDLFREWFAAAEESGLILPEAMTLATATRDGIPSARMVLLKGFGEDGFRFFTNYASRKSRELTENPNVALVFHWGVLQRQVRIEGTVSKLSRTDSDEYFQSRGRGSRIGAWASKQSKRLPKRSTLENRVKRFEDEFAGKDVPLPPFWGGFLVKPISIEFWQGKADRLHDRLLFIRTDSGWVSERLYP